LNAANANARIYQLSETMHDVHSVAAASTAPVSLNIFGLEMVTSTGYFHSMNLAHPVPLSASYQAFVDVAAQDDAPQYAAFLPKYFPRYGTMTIVNSSSSCCNDSFHSRSASDMYSSSSASELVEEEGKESTSSAEECSMKLSLLLIDMAGLVTNKLKRRVAVA
jgi:hypothetical protein